jgi:ABC-type nitrate/sulfonate/bicarbonate transport system permease component
MKKSNALLPLVGVAMLLAIWGLTTALRLVDPVLLPSPLATFRTLWEGMLSGKLGVDFLKTVMRTISSTAIAAVIAIPLGILLGSSEKLYRSVEFLIDFFRSTPASAMFPLFLVLFGVRSRPSARRW